MCDTGKLATVRLGDVCSKIGSGATPRGGSNVYLESGDYALVRSQNVYNEGFNNYGIVFISSEHAGQLRNVELDRDDVLLNITGDSVARCCQVPENILPCRVNQHVSIIRPKRDILNPRYLRYFLTSPQMQAYMLTLASSGATRNALTKGMIESFQIHCPPIKEQRTIAHILGTLDDKIELNRQMNETLEAIARSIFKSWFVDFDPVRAKAEGRDPGLPPDIADLFPDSFEDSTMGPIPKGWKVGTIGDIGKNPRRSIKPIDVAKDIPYVGLEHIPRRCIALSEWGSAGNVISNKLYFNKFEILFGKLRPYFHKVVVSPVDGLCSTDILVIAPKLKSWFGFLLGHLSSKDLIAYTNAASTGTKMPRTNWKDIARFEIVLPPENIAFSFNQYIFYFVSYIHENIHQSRILANIRNILLPKLISGEIRVPEAEKFVKEFI